MSEQNEQLLPCPFCGGTNLQVEVDGRRSDYVMCGTPDRDGCGVMVSRIDCEGDPREAWNRRAQPAPTVQADEERFDSALATFLAEHTRLTQDGIDQHAASIAAALNDEALRPVPAEDIEFWIEEGYLTAPAHASSDGRDAVLRMFERSAYPVATEIDPRGYRWSEAWLDEAYAALRALAGTGVKGGGS